jgi:hypothetical protein
LVSLLGEKSDGNRQWRPVIPFLHAAREDEDVAKAALVQ